jgi:hypothetical protein
MKKKRIIIWSIITLLTIIAAMEIFDSHPSLQLGGFRIRWNGVSHMAFTSGSMTGSGGLIQGRWDIYLVGPFMILHPA